MRQASVASAETTTRNDRLDVTLVIAALIFALLALMPFVTELAGGVKILDKEGKVLALLGENPNPKQRGQNGVKPAECAPAHFTAPHGLAYDGSGNLYVQDWNAHGRITKLVKIKPGSQN